MRKLAGVDCDSTRNDPHLLLAPFLRHRVSITATRCDRALTVKVFPLERSAPVLRATSYGALEPASVFALPIYGGILRTKSAVDATIKVKKEKQTKKTNKPRGTPFTERNSVHASRHTHGAVLKTTFSPMTRTELMTMRCLRNRYTHAIVALSVFLYAGPCRWWRIVCFVDVCFPLCGARHRRRVSQKRRRRRPAAERDAH